MSSSAIPDSQNIPRWSVQKWGSRWKAQDCLHSNNPDALVYEDRDVCQKYVDRANARIDAAMRRK